MGKIEKILKKGPVEGQTTEVYPVTSTKAVYDENNKRLDNIITGLQESVYLNNPIPISTENTPEANAQNVKNITDYIEKAKAAGIADVNGMAVTCLIDDYFSGVGYIMGNTDVAIQGIKIPDDLVDNTIFTIYNGVYSERTVIAVGTSNKVDSDMLNKGARKPIILTPDTTEVDEETYQKLLSDDVDVLFNGPDGEFCTLTYKDANTDYLNLYFTCFSVEGETSDDIYISAYKVEIEKNAPHTCTISILKEGQTLSDEILSFNYIQQSQLSQVLQNIDLTGTDAERKAKLDQFKANWKALTGVSYLSGARFVGSVIMNDEALTNVLLSYDIDGNYSGISMSDDVDVFHLKKIVVHPNNGLVESIPLFSHLEPLEILTDNTIESKQKNIDNLNAYHTNLDNLGVDTSNGFQVPIIIFNAYVGSLHYSAYDNIYVGIYFSTDDNGVYFFQITSDGEFRETAFVLQSDSITVDTTISDTSTNPVQNKVIKAYIDGLVGNVTAQLAQI